MYLLSFVVFFQQVENVIYISNYSDIGLKEMRRMLNSFWNCVRQDKSQEVLSG
jgi:hypothetical protein